MCCSTGWLRPPDSIGRDRNVGRHDAKNLSRIGERRRDKAKTGEKAQCAEYEEYFVPKKIRLEIAVADPIVDQVTEPS
jgi:nitrogen regulatory protein PII